MPSPSLAQSCQLSEEDFLAEIPRVISASRLPQAPEASPAVVTVIDREMIRASGARDLAELFQLVPGFHWGTPRGGRDVVAYHGLSGQFSQRMQVLLDLLVMDACMEVIRVAASGCAEDPVRGIGISSQGEAFTTIGPDGEVLTNAMVSSDCRAASIARTWSDEFGARRLYEITGHNAAPLFSLFKFVWLRDNMPDVWRRAKAFYCFEDLVQWSLGLDPAISWCLAGRTAMFNIRAQSWDAEILDAVGLGGSKLARPIPSGEVAGTIPKRISDELGLGEGVIVVAGGHDQSCGAMA